jgi:hypothetical protein
MAARPYIGQNILVETRPVEVLHERTLHRILSGVTAVMGVVMSEDFPDDAGIIRGIRSVARVIDVTQEASHGVVRGVWNRGVVTSEVPVQADQTKELTQVFNLARR